MVNLLILLVGAGLAGILYRAGGMSRDKDTEPKFIPVFARRSCVRDWLIPPIMLSCLVLTKHPDMVNIWVYLSVWCLMGGAFSTYWDDTDNKILDKICRTINWMYPIDNMYLHGFFVGLATIPCMFLGIKLYSIVIYTIALGLSMGFVSHKTKLNATQKELIRGALVIILIPILLT